uniref:G-protein coupled receptors family 1 profile domain-containing protein n=1 Tax=Leptobrachium leishanense TaxID=445787 RepID=A0A8C5PB66_9ANUR
MLKPNRTVITEFLLLGFGNLHSLKMICFISFLLIYIMSLMGNVLVILLVMTNRSLHSPMYFFLSQMSVSEIIFTSNIVPNMLHLILAGGGNMSITQCLIQFYLLGVPTIAQCLLLAAMSFDRYVAICNPLHYSRIMTIKLQVQLTFICWFLGFSLTLLIYVFLNELQFCDSNVINHFYCDVPPVLALSCSDTFAAELVTSLVSFPIILSPFGIIITTYVSILITIFKIPTTSGRQKAFSTCSSHLTIVCMYYGTLTTIYIFPPKESLVSVNKGLSLLYTLVTPLLNPVIYTLRNRDIRQAIQKCLEKGT